MSPGRIGGQGRSCALGHKNGDLVALGRLLRPGVAVRWATEAVSADRGRSSRRHLLVPTQRARSSSRWRASWVSSPAP